MCTWHGSLKPTCQPHNKGISFDTTFHNGYYRGIITLRFRKYLHFAYSSSTFITYSPNLSPFLSTISHHLACQDVFPIARKTVTLSETGADCYNGCRLCSDTGEFMLHFRQILNSFYLTEITDTLYCYHTEFTDTTIYGFLLGHYIYHS